MLPKVLAALMPRTVKLLVFQINIIAQCFKKRRKHPLFILFRCGFNLIIHNILIQFLCVHPAIHLLFQIVIHIFPCL